MGTSMKTRDRRFAELYADLKTQWVHHTAAYLRSIRLYQERVSERRSRRMEERERTAQPSPLRPTRGEIAPVPSVDDPPPVRTPLALPSTRRERAGKGPLTGRQLEVAELIAQGLTNAEIADRLVLSRGTVGNHIGQMLRRLSVKNRAQIAAWMIRHDDQYGNDPMEPPRHLTVHRGRGWGRRQRERA